jgi:hypothetical protein
MLDEDKYYMNWEEFKNSADDVQKLFPIRDVLSVHFGLTPQHNGRCSCPIHQGNDANLAIYPESNTVHCFSHCNKSWNAITLVQEDFKNNGCSEGSYKKALFTLCDEFGVDPLTLPGISEKKYSHVVEPKPKPKEPEKTELEKAFTHKTIVRHNQWFFNEKSLEMDHANVKEIVPLWQKLLNFSRNPFEPIITGCEKDERGQKRIAKKPPLPIQKTAAFICYQLQVKAKELQRAKNILEWLANESFGYEFENLYKPYQKLYSLALAQHPAKLSEEDVRFMKLNFLMSDREIEKEDRLLTLFQIYDEFQDYLERVPYTYKMKDVPKDFPSYFTPEFKDLINTIKSSEYLEKIIPIYVPDEGDLAEDPRPGSDKKVIADVTKWIDELCTISDYVFDLGIKLKDSLREYFDYRDYAKKKKLGIKDVDINVESNCFDIMGFPEVKDMAEDVQEFIYQFMTAKDGPLNIFQDKLVKAMKAEEKKLQEYYSKVQSAEQSKDTELTTESRTSEPLQGKGSALKTASRISEPSHSDDSLEEER